MKLESAMAGPRRRTAAAGVLLGVLAAAIVLYLLSPAATATHVEGFTALIALNAIAAQQGLIARADLLYPVQTEYFYLTRQGVVLLLRALMGLTGSSGDVLFRVVTQVSLVVFLGSIAGLARRYGRLPWPAIVAAIVLLPGLFELGFFFSDSIVASAFGLLGLALLPHTIGGRGDQGAAAGRSRNVDSAGSAGSADSADSASSNLWALRAGAAGLSIGLAALARTDALLLLPLAAALVWHDQRRVWPAVAVLATLAAGLVAMFLLSYAVSGTTILQSIQIGRFFDNAHRYGRWGLLRLAALTFFFGLPGLVLIAIGLAGSVRSVLQWHRLPVVVAGSLLLVWALRGATEARQVYPMLAPLAVILCGRGLLQVVRWLRRPGSWGFPAGALVAVGTALVWLLPPLAIVVRDGPRPIVGRLWSPPLWQDWQQRVDASLVDVESLIERAERAPRLVAITAHYNTDHYFQLRAWQRGWVPMTEQETQQACPAGVQVWGKGGSRMVQVRVESPYGIPQDVKPGYFIPLQLAQALKCPAVLDGGPVYFSDFEPTLITDAAGGYLAAKLPAVPAARAFYAWPAVLAQPLIDRVRRSERLWWMLPPYYGVNRSVLIDRADVLRAQRLAEDAVADFAPGQFSNGPALAEFQAHFRNRYWRPPVSAQTVPSAPAP